MALKRLKNSFVFICACLVLAGCSVDGTSREESLRQTIDDIQKTAEARKLGEMMNFVSDDYVDTRGQSRETIQRMAQIQFIRYPKIYTFKSISNLALHDDNNASVILLVAVAGQPIESASALLNLSADLLKFDLTFVYDDEWKITSAEWGSAQAGDFIR